MSQETAGSRQAATDGQRPRVRVELPASHPASGAAMAGVALVTIDRTEALNALDHETMRQLLAALEGLDSDPACRCIVITGAGERAFAAGADIREMAEATPESMAALDALSSWDRVAAISRPIIAAVRGFALGGGCELAMACDMIVAAEDAVFGQPEIRLGVIPGAGGTQRLARALGKARTMELVLTGAQLDAAEAERRGLVNRVVPASETVARALELAALIAAQPPLAVAAATAAIDQAFETSLAAGVAHEREAFYRLFDSADQKEGMRAFLEKRAPVWKGR